MLAICRTLLSYLVVCHNYTVCMFYHKYIYIEIPLFQIVRKLSVNWNDLPALDLVGSTRDNPVPDPLAVLHLDNPLLLCILTSFRVRANRLYICSGKYMRSYLTQQVLLPNHNLKSTRPSWQDDCFYLCWNVQLLQKKVTLLWIVNQTITRLAKPKICQRAAF